MRIIQFLTAFFISVIPLLGFTQTTGTLKGRVYDSNGKNLELVTVSITNTQKPIGTSTDNKGNYSLKVPANAELTVKFSSMGFESRAFIVTLKPNETYRLNCELSFSSKTLPTHEIKEERFRETGEVSIDLKDIKDITGPKGGIESILPGASSSNEMSSQYSVRGGNFDENLVYINGIEIYRPFLVRSGQQEGLSIVNPDMVSNILFSTGGFDAKYGDKMSSVLDITYKKPQQFSGSVSGSLLGASLYIEDLIKDKFSYNIGVRQHSNKNIVKSLEQKGEYKTSYTDVQGYFNYKHSSKLDFSFLGIFSNNIYEVVPTDRETDFGDMNNPMKLKIYFDGEEKDKFQTLLGAFTSTYSPTENTQLQLIASGFNSQESEVYDILGEYWISEATESESGAKDIGTYLDHGRNKLYANVFSIEHKGLVIKPSGNWNWGVKYQNEYIYNNLNEWQLIDSAGYTVPSFTEIPGDPNPGKNPPMLQSVIRSKNETTSNRYSGFAQKNWRFYSKSEDIFTLVAGVRAQYWDFNKEFLVSPRVSVSFQPHQNKNLIFRLATGVYSQSPFYREYRTPDGKINKDIKSQKSYQIVGAADYQFKAWDRPFKFVTEIYYKYIDDLIPYTIDNLRIVYAGHNNAKGYAAGIDLRLNGEFVPGIESWASMTIMSTKEDIEGDGYGYLPRPTDQRFLLKLFLQDYIPSIPWWKMNILFSFGSGTPFTQPGQTDFSKVFRYPAYIRADWGTSLQIKNPSSKWAQNNILRYIKNAWIHLEVFNIFDNRNTLSYLWISDHENKQYAVPNYLTRRRLNIKLSLDF